VPSFYDILFPGGEGRLVPLGHSPGPGTDPVQQHIDPGQRAPDPESPLD
jgi:hypothetical protein